MNLLRNLKFTGSLVLLSIIFMIISTVVIFNFNQAIILENQSSTFKVLFYGKVLMFFVSLLLFLFSLGISLNNLANVRNDNKKALERGIRFGFGLPKNF